MAEDDSFDDMEMDSIRDMMSKILEKTNPPGVNSKIAAMSTEPAPRHTNGHPADSTPTGDQPQRPSVSSGSIDLANNLSVSVQGGCTPVRDCPVKLAQSKDTCP